MQLRIRLSNGPRIARIQRAERRLALGLSALLTPAALMAFALAFWRFGADMEWTDPFAISDGIFSHWQVWGGMGFLIEVCAVALDRYGRGGNPSAP